MKQKRQTEAVKRVLAKRQSCSVQPKPDQLTAAMQRAIQRVRHMSHRERVQSLKAAGILTPGGKLAAAYQ